MRVVFLADIPQLGRRGEVKEVSDGYGRNFLIPKKFAAVVTPALIAQYERERTQRIKEDEKIRREAEALARRLDGITLTLSSKASASGTLYAAVGPSEIAAELRKRGFGVEEGWVKMPRAMKKVGESQVAVTIPQSRSASISIKVLAANSNNQ